MRKTTLLPAVLMTAVVVLSATPSLHAKTFRNAYISFEIGDKWDCKPEQTEWVCRTSDPGLAEAIIILTAKEVGPHDALAAYETHLKTPRTIMSRTGQSIQSTAYRIEQRKIANHTWVDGMHFSSEVWNYYTRYLATIKERIAVLVTFSAHKLHYTKYSADFFRAIESLRVTASRSLMNASGQGAQLPGSGSIYGGAIDTGMLGEPGSSYDDMGGGGGGGFFGGSDSGMLALALILGGAGAYLYIKRRRKNSGE